LRINRISDRESDLVVRTERSKFLPTLGSSLEHSGGDSGRGSQHSNTTTLGGSVTQKTPWGTTVTGSTNLSADHPQSGSSKRLDYGLSVAQPLWKGFGTDVNLHDLN